MLAKNERIWRAKKDEVSQTDYWKMG